MTPLNVVRKQHQALTQHILDLDQVQNHRKWFIWTTSVQYPYVLNISFL